MLSILADLPSPSTPAAIGWFALAASATLVCVNQALKFFDRFKENPPTNQVYVTKHEHTELKNRVDKIAEEITRGFERLDQKRSVSIAGLHEDLDETKQQLNERIDEVPARTITLLRETQQLHHK